MFPLMIVLVNILKDSGKGNKNVKYCPELVSSFFFSSEKLFILRRQEVNLRMYISKKDYK